MHVSPKCEFILIKSSSLSSQGGSFLTVVLPFQPQDFKSAQSVCMPKPTVDLLHNSILVSPSAYSIIIINFTLWGTSTLQATSCCFAGRLKGRICPVSAWIRCCKSFSPWPSIYNLNMVSTPILLSFQLQALQVVHFLFSKIDITVSTPFHTLKTNIIKSYLSVVPQYPRRMSSLQPNSPERYSKTLIFRGCTLMADIDQLRVSANQQRHFLDYLAAGHEYAMKRACFFEASVLG